MGSEVAQNLAKQNISIEVIDLRTLVPLDIDTILTSIQKTGKVLIAHEAPLCGGFGAEIAAQIAESAFTYLDAPIQRIGSLNCPVPYSKILEDEVLPQRPTLEAALKDLALF